MNMEIDYDFDGSLRLSDVVEDYFYSPSTKLYVFRHPLIVDKRVLEVVDKLGIKADASPEKWLVNTKLSDFLNILKELDSTAMSLPDYFNIRKDAIDLKDDDMLSSLESDKFIEMFASVFLHDKYVIHHPDAQGPLNFLGEKILVDTPKGRYGWIHPDKIDLKTGLPTEVRTLRNLNDDTMKYWDTHTDIGKEGVLMTVRGYVTSVGKISLDLGFPADAISHKLSIRECKKSQPKGTLDEKILSEAKDVLSNYYDDFENNNLYNQIPKWYKNLLSFIYTKKEDLNSANDVASQVLKEDIRDALGIIWTYAKQNNKSEIASEIKSAALYFSNLSKNNVSDKSFISFVKNRKNKLEEAVKNHESVVFVMGHNNPDTDAIVSAVAEAYRQQLIDKESIFIPVIPGSKIPKEVVKLFGTDLSKSLILSDDKNYLLASNKGRPEWIMVDHNIGPEQPNTRAIIDHHYPSDVSLRQQIPRRILFAGSTTALVTQRFYGLGVEIPKEMARILHGATLMDTENRFEGKMTSIDELIMDRLQKDSTMNDESVFYQDLMKELVSCYDSKELFIRDYKEDWCYFGFAVAKGIEILDDNKSNLIKDLHALAKENNKSKNLPLTLVKIVDYANNAETIRKERMYTVFMDDASDDYKKAVKETIITVIKHESSDNVQIQERDDFIEYWGVGTQLSRKKLAPVLDLVVNAFNQYFYSPSTGLYFKRDFLRNNEQIEEISRKNGLKLHTDNKGVVVGNPSQLKFYLQELGLISASPAEYFKAYFDAVKVNDERMVSHLTSSQYLETLDAVIENKTFLVEHPNILMKSNNFSYENSNRKKVFVPIAEPGLINLDKIDLSTGLPIEVEDPNQYGKGLWRYWSPDSDCAWVLRSTIFAYDIPALDLKFRFDEELPRLSIRPCVRTVKNPQVKVYEKGDGIVVDIKN